MPQPLPLLAYAAADADHRRLIAVMLSPSPQDSAALTEGVRAPGANHFLWRLQRAGMPKERVLDAMTLFEERVIPRLRDV